MGCLCLDNDLTLGHCAICLIDSFCVNLLRSKRQWAITQNMADQGRYDLHLQSVSWSFAEFRHNKIVQLLRENCFNVCRQLQRKVRSGKHDV